MNPLFWVLLSPVVGIQQSLLSPSFSMSPCYVKMRSHFPAVFCVMSVLAVLEELARELVHQQAAWSECLILHEEGVRSLATTESHRLNSLAQLFRRQAQLSRRSALALQAAIPGLSSGLVEEMMTPPLRSYDSDIAKDPCIYRLNEAVMHFGESIKDVINEDFGDGIMSAIDFYCSVKKVKDKDGKDRVVITFDGKYLPYAEQFSENMQSIQNQ